MDAFLFILWMIGHSALYTYGRVAYAKAGIVFSDNVIGIAALIRGVIHISVAIFLFNRIH